MKRYDEDINNNLYIYDSLNDNHDIQELDPKEVIVTNKTKIIKDWSFCFCSHLEKVIIYENVKKIGLYAFGDCISLKQVDTGNVSKIGEGAFCNCISLQEVILSDNLTAIEPATFRACKSLREIVIPASVNKIDKYAFEDCISLERITIEGEYRPQIFYERSVSGNTPFVILNWIDEGKKEIYCKR